MMQGLDRFGPLGKHNTLRSVCWYTTVTSPSTHATAWASFFGDFNVRFFLKKNHEDEQSIDFAIFFLLYTLNSFLIWHHKKD